MVVNLTPQQMLFFFFGKRQCKPISTLLMIRGDVFFKFTDIYGYIYTLLCNFLGKPCHERRELHTILLVLVDCILYIYTQNLYTMISHSVSISTTSVGRLSTYTLPKRARQSLVHVPLSRCLPFPAPFRHNL